MPLPRPPVPSRGLTLARRRGQARDQVARIDCKPAGQAADVLERNVAMAALEAAHVCALEPGAMRQLFLRDSQPLPHVADAVPEELPHILANRFRSTSHALHQALDVD